MGNKILSLIADPRYPDFVDRYCFDITRFAIEVFGITPTWQQIELFESVQGFGSRTSVSSGHGCFGLGTPIMRADGSVSPVEAIRVGDTLMGADGASVRNVLELKRGREAMYRFTYSDGSSHVFNESHILCLVDEHGDEIETYVRNWLKWGSEKRAAYTCYRLTEYGYSPLPIESVDSLGEGNYYGFELDGDGKFIGGDSTVLHNTGKTNGFGIIAAWHLLCYVNSNTFITAPRLATVHDGVWKEFANLHAAMLKNGQAWIADYFKIEHERVYVAGYKLNWFITAKTAPTGRPENLAGSHNEWLLWLCDESSGIPDANFGVIGGSMTDENNRWVLASQPTRDSGFFRETHNRLSILNGGTWRSLVFNSEESPIVSTAFIREKLAQYGGRDSPEYMIKVRGIFPENSDKYLLSRKMIEARVKATPTIGDDEAYGNLLIIDVAAGVYRDKTVATHVRVIGNGDRMSDDARRVDVVAVPIFTNRLDWQDVAGLAFQYAMTISNCTVIVDTGGQGVQFAKMLERMGCPNVIHSNWGKPCFRTANKERFINLRAQCSVNAAEAVKDGRITFTDEHLKDLLDQGSRIPFYFDEKGRWHIVSKEDMADDGIPSPDYWDTICMAFLEGAHYIQNDGTGLCLSVSGNAADEALARAKEALGDLA